MGSIGGLTQCQHGTPGPRAASQTATHTHTQMKFRLATFCRGTLEEAGGCLAHRRTDSAASLVRPGEDRSARRCCAAACNTPVLFLLPETISLETLQSSWSWPQSLRCFVLLTEVAEVLKKKVKVKGLVQLRVGRHRFRFYNIEYYFVMQF